MTDDEALALAVRLVACKHFRPMPGMRDLQGRTWTPDLIWRWNRTIDRPDLRDPATLGCLLALVREAHACDFLHLSYRLADDTIRFACFHHGPMPWVESEAEALVAALEAAP